MGDSYRPMRHDREQPPPRKLADRITFGDGGDNYRPGGQNRSDFTFESKHPAPHFPPSGPANGSSRGPPRSNRNGGGRGGRRGDHHGRGNANGSRRGRPYQKPAPHQRALLQHHDDGQEQTYGVSDGPNRFMNIDDMSDHEEADMDESDASGNGEVAEGQDGNHKVARTLAPRDDGNAVPKWSNPDPYTSLPPPSETTGVKKDVVKLIRKAKNQAAEKAIGNNAVAANDDFISFGDDAGDDGSEDGEVDDEPGLQIYEDDEPVRGRAKDNVSHRPVQGSMNDLTYVGNVIDDSRRNGYDSYTPTQPSSGNKRKAGRDVPIVHEWILTSRSGNPTPWAASTQTYKHLAKDPKKWLHNEILDFYDWVAPQQYEHSARDKLVKRISDALGSQRWFPQDNGRILCFGSYPAGLYLPTADMDLVYASDRLYNGGPPVLESATDRAAFTRTLRKASQRLQKVGIANNPFVIAKARVPIIKFKDRLTGLDVDISFENLSGVQAQATFDQWKNEYPDMLYMVALVKQLLVMRGLNEVHTGGLGGFSIICLIVSYIQHAKKAENLGDCFLGFLKYYGKDFDLSRKRIQMNPPAVLNKSTYGIDGREESDTGLSIQDPNKLDNNISGGSRRAAEAFNVFSAAHDTLADRLKASELGQEIGPSILACIIGGNYDSYLKQRHRLSTIPQQDYDSEEEHINIAQMSADDWSRKLRWMHNEQTNTARSRTMLSR